MIKNVGQMMGQISYRQAKKALIYKAFPVVFRCPLQENLHSCIEENSNRYLK